MEQDNTREVLVKLAIEHFERALSSQPSNPGLSSFGRHVLSLLVTLRNCAQMHFRHQLHLLHRANAKTGEVVCWQITSFSLLLADIAGY